MRFCSHNGIRRFNSAVGSYGKGLVDPQRRAVFDLTARSRAVTGA